MATAQTRKSRHVAKHMTTAELPAKIRELRAALSEGTSLLQAMEKELSRRRVSEANKKSLREKITIEKGKPDGDQQLELS